MDPTTNDWWKNQMDIWRREMSEIPLDCWDWFDMDKMIIDGYGYGNKNKEMKLNKWSDFDEFEYGIH